MPAHMDLTAFQTIRSTHTQFSCEFRPTFLGSFSSGPGPQDFSAMEHPFPSGTLLQTREGISLPSFPDSTSHLCCLMAMCQGFEILQKMDLGGPTIPRGSRRIIGEVESHSGSLASIPTCTSMKEAGICPFTNTCCGLLHGDWPLKSSAL